MNRYLAACLLLLLSITSFAQDTSYTDTKEKVYVQTNHVFFKPGETMFFKIYVVKAKDNTPSWKSAAVYAELLNPAGNVVKKARYAVTDGYAEGSFDFEDEARGGVYKIRAYTQWMRNEKDSSFFTREITLQKVITPRILMKLDFPQKGYGAGNTVTADFSMRNLSDEPIRFFSANFLVSLDGKAVQSGTFRTDREGKAKVSFVLPNELKSTDGLLNITVNYDSYTEAISRSIPLVLHHIDLQFMPEGGSLAAGLPSVVAFRAVNDHGKPVDIKGSIIDDKSKKVAELESFHGGMGRFSLTPAAGTQYHVQVVSPANITDHFVLPDVQPAGVTMHVEKENHHIRVQLFSKGEMPVTLAAEARGTVYDQQALTLHAGVNTVDLDESRFPVGIARLTVFSPTHLPFAERLVFLNEDRNLQVKITTDKKRYLPREPVQVTIRTLDESGRPVPANLSLSVVDDQLWTFADDKQDHILSWLLLNSELHGQIDEPQFYFRKDEPKAIAALDLVMLTHGYRYFDYIANASPAHPAFAAEYDQGVTGYTTDAQGNRIPSTVLLVSNGPDGRVLRQKTDSTGTFFFSGLGLGTAYYLVAQPDRRGPISIRVLQQGDVDAASMGMLNPVWEELGVPGAAPALAGRRAAAKPRAVMNDDIAPMRLGGAAQLNEVVVVGFGTTRRKDLAAAIQVVQAKELEAMNHVDRALNGKVAGLVVTPPAEPQGYANIRIRGIGSINGGNQPLILLDGVPVEYVALQNLDLRDLNAVTVIKDAQALAIYGSRAANGVISIETRKYYSEKIDLRLTRPFVYALQYVKLEGTAFTPIRRFYAPKYTEADVEEKKDFRPTIYWNPVVQTDGEGKAQLTYCNSDATTTFRLIAEGIGYQGLIGRAEQTYAAKNALGVDAKIPPYLTVGDRALLPLVIRNNRMETAHIRISVIAPNGLKVGSFAGAVEVMADSSRQVLIPVEATAAVKGELRFVVEGAGRTQKIVLPITANDKGFPVVITCSGNGSSDHDINIAHVVPGSIKPHLKLFRNLEGQLLDGIESMLREPGGCFEQTSSSTYPNIYVLKYLRESGRSNPEVEKKALGYISNGYKRLISFETSKNGFEWFGHTPPHEALTAYGLLEFTDMQEFIKVDPDMLARTRKFLLDRRDGHGSFLLASGGYDRFASVPDKIANIYIVYALTQAGLSNEIELEYRTAVNKALASNDAYQLAMMALAASNMKNRTDYVNLIAALDQLNAKKGLTAETSVTNSRETSLTVETKALYALALMRDPANRMADVAALLSSILSAKSYYGYGSTQATVLALQAIVNYGKLMNKMSKDVDIRFALNGQKVEDDSAMVALFHEGMNRYSVQYGSAGGSVPYSFELAYNTLLPPNSEKAELKLATRLASGGARVGETVRMTISVHNEKNQLQPMAIAKIGIPAGLSLQPWQLKELMENNGAAYYEIFDNYLVLYWMGFAPNETKTIALDLKAEIAGTYKGKASNVYLYYTPEDKNWNEGTELEIE